MEFASPIDTSPAYRHGTPFFSPPRDGGSGALGAGGGSRWSGGNPTAATVATTAPKGSPSPGRARVADSDIPELRCRCSEPCRVRTSRTEKNPGRKFYSCPFYQTNKKSCGFFKWVDEVVTQSVDAAAAAAVPPTPQCPCQAGWCLRLTFDTGEQAGQKCFICPRKTQKCGFFQLCDLGNSIGRSPAMDIQQSRDNFDQAHPTCPCGAGPCKISMDGVGEHAGMKWYVCPVRKGEGACNFRIICDSFRNCEDFNVSHAGSQCAASLYMSDGPDTADGGSSIMDVEREPEGTYAAPAINGIAHLGYSSAPEYRTPDGLQNQVINEAGFIMASASASINSSFNNPAIGCSPLGPISGHVGSLVSPHVNTGLQHNNLSCGGSSFRLPNEKIDPSSDKSAVGGSSSRVIASEGFMLPTFASPSSLGNNLATVGPSIDLQYPSSKHVVQEINFGFGHLPSSPTSSRGGSPYHSVIAGGSPSTPANNRAGQFLISPFATRDVQDDNLAGSGYGLLSPGSALASPVAKMCLQDADWSGGYVANNMHGSSSKGGSQNTNLGGRASSPRVGACYRCGKDGHWVNECSLPPSSPAGLCKKCGKVGHWKKDCTFLALA